MKKKKKLSLKSGMFPFIFYLWFFKNIQKTLKTYKTTSEFILIEFKLYDKRDSIEVNYCRIQT